jgi:hypothetical protein
MIFKDKICQQEEIAKIKVSLINCSLKESQLFIILAELIHLFLLISQDKRSKFLKNKQAQSTQLKMLQGPLVDLGSGNKKNLFLSKARKNCK